MAWAAVFAVARVELRTRWRALVVLGLLFGLMGGAVIATATVTRRTDSAYPRLVAATYRPDATVNIYGDRADLANQVTRLPGVRRSWTAGVWMGQVHHTGGRDAVSVIAGPEHPADLFQPVVLQGRAPRDDAVNEILISEVIAQGAPIPVDVGTPVELTLLTAGQFASFDTDGFSDVPAGPTVPLLVVGIGRLPLWDEGTHVMVTAAFAAKYRPVVLGYQAMLQLVEGEPARRAFAEGLDGLAAANPPPPELVEFGPLRARYPAAEEQTLIAPARRTLVAALTISTALAAVVTLLVIAQALARHHALGVDSQRVEAALGMTRLERAAARTLPAVPSALLAATIGAAAGLAAGGLPALGSQLDLEPTFGYLPDVTAAALGGACLAALVLLGAAGAAAATLRRHTAAAPASIGRVPTGWLPPAVRAGWSLAVVPARWTVLAVGMLGFAAALAAVAAAVMFGANLERLVTTPSSYGWTSDLTLHNAKDSEIARLVADQRVAALEVVTSGEAHVGTALVLVYAFEHRKGAAGPALVAGRLPANAGEVAVGPRLAASHELTIGDSLVFDRFDGGTIRLRVVGVAVVRLVGSDFRLGNQMVLSPGGLSSIVGTLSWRDADIRAVAGQADTLAAELRKDLEISRAEPPLEITGLADIRLLPYTLAAVAGGAAVVGLLHTLYVARRRHRRQFAILRAIGFTRGQLRAMRAVMAAALVVPALAVGVAVGLGVGRLVWYEVAVASGVGGEALVPVGWLIAIAAAALIAAGIAAIIGWPRSPEPVGSTLRVE